MSRRWWVLLLLLLLLLSGSGVQAQAPERVETFVYGINAAAPDGVIGTFAPPTIETIYLLAGQTSVLSPRRTLVYFWPITNEYRAAWSSLNEPVEGTLEIVQNGRQVGALEQVEYTIHFGAGEGAPKPVLYLGAAALEANRRFEAEREAYRQAVLAYEKARTAWLDVAREGQSRRADGEEVAIPPPPEPPPPLNTFSTGINRGYPVALAPGTYDIRVRLADGRIEPKSVRRLVVFAPRRTAVGYTVVPESRWTTPEELTDLADVVLGQRGSVLYLKPHVIREYPTLPYEYLLNPQYPGDARGPEWRWVAGEALDEGIMEIVRGGKAIERVPLTPYRVRQIPGAALGYEILPFDPNDPGAPRNPDFAAYRITLSDEVPAYEVRLVSNEGRVLLGSQRQVRVLSPVDLRLLLLLPLIPILLGWLVITLRRKRTAPVRVFSIIRG